MKRVAFISTQAGTDLVVSFAMYSRDEPRKVESLTIIRTPQHKRTLHAWEPGATVSFDSEIEKFDAVLLCGVQYSIEAETVIIVTNQKTYELDVQKVAPEEVKEMCRVFRIMNADTSVSMAGI